MKVALIFLVCFVSLSYQYVWMPYPVPRELHPGYFHLGSQHFYQQQPKYAYPEETIEGDEEQTLPDAHGRISNKVQQRLFFPNFNLFSLANLFSSTTTTSTVFTTVTSTVTIASQQNCLVAAAFGQAAGPPAITSTTPCGRRRRDVMEILDSIAPSQVTPLEMTALPEPINNQRETRELEIVSSLESVSKRETHDETQRQSRAITMSVSTTSTIISYVFTTSAVKKTWSLAAAAALTCMPPGFSLC